MHSINWQQFGLKKNPYDTLPLIEGGELPIEKAFVGRKKERVFLNSLFESEDRLSLVVSGEVGVGKTSLVNFHKFQWKYHKKRPLFSFRREIEASDYLLNKKNFLIEIIGSIVREIELVDPSLLKHPLLKKINRIVDITQEISVSVSGNISAGVFGAGVSGGRQIEQPLQLSMAALEKYFYSLLTFIKKKKIARKKYSGLIVHINNFDIISIDPQQKKKLISFFNEIRDILQTPSVYFLFLGSDHFFQEIISAHSRVKSIFYQTPLVLEPLAKEEIVEAFNERMNILRSEKVKAYIKPFEDEVIFTLYDIYKGDIRSIMASLGHILAQYPRRLRKTLGVNDALLLLGQWQWERINYTMGLTKEQKEILVYIAKNNTHVSQKDIARIFKKAQTNISGYYFKPLTKLGVIEVKKSEGREKYWGLTEEFDLIKFIHRNKK